MEGGGMEVEGMGGGGWREGGGRVEGGWRVEGWRMEGGGRNAASIGVLKAFTIEVEVYKPCGTA